VAARDRRRGTARPGPPVVHVVLPAYDEQSSIGDLIARIAEVMDGAGLAFDILVVDDGSTDATAGIARAGRNTTVVSNERNRGLGVTISRGLRMAADSSGPGSVIVTMDADLTQDPMYIPSMIGTWRQGADVVIASRFRPGSRVHGLSWDRHVMTWGARVVVSALMSVPGVRDYSCGFRLYDPQVLTAAFDALGDGFVTQTGFACMVEIVAKLRGSARMAEVPFELHYDAKRTPSAMRIGPTVRAYFTVIGQVRGLRRAGVLPLAAFRRASVR
jgi:dolichol-phosphate mannosyltransferase